MHYVEYSERRSGNPVVQAFAGVLLFIASFLFLFWNEGRSIATYTALKEGAAAVITVSSDTIDSENEGKLIHTTGFATTEETLHDPLFDVSENALRMRRVVEMYQWEETRRRRTSSSSSNRDEYEYRYRQVWSEEAINSRRFRDRYYDQNPQWPSPELKSESFSASEVTMGAFKLPSSLVTRIRDYSNVRVDSVPQRFRGKATTYDRGFYFGQSPSSPEIGDLRVRYRAVKPMTVSVVAAQRRDTFNPYATSSGETIALIQTGNHDSESMFETAIQQNTIMTWGIRLAGFLCMFAGLAMILSPLSYFASFIPFLGNLVKTGVGLFAFLVSLCLSALTIGFAWIAHRPLLGGVLLGVSVIAGILSLFRLKSS